MSPLYKTTIVIWSRDNPAAMELSTLAREAEIGSAYCAKNVSVWVKTPKQDPDWDCGEFFD